jgi:hypothetical protein
VIYLALFSLAFLAYSRLWREAPVKTNDSAGYMAVAQDLVDLRLDRLRLRPPGYPLLLLITGSSREPTRMLFFVSMLFHFASVWLLGAILRASGLSSRLVILFGVLMILPPFVEPAAKVLTENLIEFILVSGFAGVVFGMVRGKAAGLAVGAVAFGYSGLVHPTYQFLSLALAACLFGISHWFYWARLRIQNVISAASLLVIAFIILIGGCILNNYLRFNYMGITPFIGYALSSKTMRVLERLPDDYGAVREALIAARDADLVESGGSHTGVSYIWRAEDNISRITGLEGEQLSRYLVRLNLLLIRKAPLHYLQEVLLATVGFWEPASGQLANFDSSFFQAIWAALDILLSVTFTTQLVVLSGATALLLSKRFVASKDEHTFIGPRMSKVRTVSYTLALSIVCYTMIIVSVFGTGTARYRTPVEGLIVFMGFLGFDTCFRMTRPLQLSARETRVQTSPSQAP